MGEVSLHPHLGRVRLSSDRDGLLPEMKIIGYAIAGNMRTRLVDEALHMAVRNQPPIVGETVFHSGAWFTLASQLNCAEVMNTYGIRASIGWNRIRGATMPQRNHSTSSCKKESVVNRKILPRHGNML